MGYPPDDVDTLARRARRVLALYGTKEKEFDTFSGDDYVVTEWEGSGLHVTHDNRSDELEISFRNIKPTKKLGGVFNIDHPERVYEEAYGKRIHVEESLVEPANEILGRMVVLDELADT